MAGKEKKQPEEQQKKVDEQPKEEKVDNVQEQPKEEKVDKEQEQPKAEQKKVDEQPKEQKEDIASIIKELKDTQTKQIAEMQASYDAKLKERDDIIKQLIKGEKATNEGTSDVADLVNKTRNYKKW